MPVLQIMNTYQSTRTHSFSIWPLQGARVENNRPTILDYNPFITGPRKHNLGTSLLKLLQLKSHDILKQLSEYIQI